MTTTGLTSSLGRSMPILLAPADTFSDARAATAVTGAGGLGAGDVATHLMTHDRADLREGVEHHRSSNERPEPSGIAQAVPDTQTQPRRVAVQRSRPPPCRPNLVSPPQKLR
jgi:NAD(P)H-dependent flavin oxidoreductase YrpB (nitropropane dioxygenase family)